MPPTGVAITLVIVALVLIRVYSKLPDVCINFIPRKTNLFAIGKQEREEDDGNE
jgi:hypothetical protein